MFGVGLSFSLSVVAAAFSFSIIHQPPVFIFSDTWSEFKIERSQNDSIIDPCLRESLFYRTATPLYCSSP
uniref:Putative secreted protein n=1 Tax=Panstrongylus lignarius TaxID=156445 RepID=A0A224XY17_9HEMI